MARDSLGLVEQREEARWERMAREDREAIVRLGGRPWREVMETKNLRNNVKMTLLALTFPCFRDAHRSAIDLWDAPKLADWARGPFATPNTAGVAAFLLAVWNPRPYDPEWTEADRAREWWPNLRPFSPGEARHGWDAEHWSAFVEWVLHPWTA